MIDLREILRAHLKSLRSTTWGKSFMLDDKDRTEAAIDYLLQEWTAVNDALRKYLKAEAGDALLIRPDGRISKHVTLRVSHAQGTVTVTSEALERVDI